MAKLMISSRISTIWKWQRLKADRKNLCQCSRKCPPSGRRLRTQGARASPLKAATMITIWIVSLLKLIQERNVEQPAEVVLSTKIIKLHHRLITQGLLSADLNRLSTASTRMKVDLKTTWEETPPDRSSSPQNRKAISNKKISRSHLLPSLDLGARA